MGEKGLHRIIPQAKKIGVWLLFGDGYSPAAELKEPPLIFINMVAPILLEMA
jgi:hypothetical protein